MMACLLQARTLSGGMRFILVLLLLASCATSDASNGDSIDVQTKSIALNWYDPAQKNIGQLRYMGGLQLSAKDKRFGGISGLRWLSAVRGPEGEPQAVSRLLAITDRGDWLLMSPQEKGGQLYGIAAVDIGRLADLDGRPLSRKSMLDSESISLIERCDENGGACVAEGALIGFEHRRRIWSYPLDANGRPGAATETGLLPKWLKDQPSNGAVEALAGQGGVWAAFSEDVRDEKTGRASGRVFACDACERWPETGKPLAVDLPAPYKPTDADFAGDALLLLARDYSPMRGVSALLGRVDMKSGAFEQIAAFRPPLNIDNFEALAVRRVAGRTFLYIASDDNFSPLQRTLLLKFELVPDSKKPTAFIEPDRLLKCVLCLGFKRAL